MNHDVKSVEKNSGKILILTQPVEKSIEKILRKDKYWHNWGKLFDRFADHA